MARSPVIYFSTAYLMTISIHVTLRRVRANRCYREKAISITHSECVLVAVVIQHAKRMRQIAICGLPGYQCFSTLSHKRRDFRRNIIQQKMQVLILSTSVFSETLLILRRIQRGTIINVHWSLYKLLVILFIS